MAMKSEESFEYQRVYSDLPHSKPVESAQRGHSDEPLLGGSAKQPSRSPSRATLIYIALTVLNAAFFIGTCLVSQYAGRLLRAECSEQKCAAITSMYSPLLEPGSAAIEYEQVKFQGSLEHQSIYQGTPSKAIDEAWEAITHMNHSVVTGDVLDRISKPRTAVKYTESQEPGGQYMVGLEVFHQLHCINFIRQYTYRDYYNRPENRPPAFTESEDVVRKHVDHCIDMLRQVVTCNGDVGIVTYNWVEGYGMHPDFSTQHKCRKLDSIANWAMRHQSVAGEPAEDADAVWLSQPPS